MVHWFFLISWILFDVEMSYLYYKLKVTCHLMIDLKIYLGQCDLCFMVQWFCLISWKLFDGAMPCMEYFLRHLLMRKYPNTLCPYSTISYTVCYNTLSVHKTVNVDHWQIYLVCDTTILSCFWFTKTGMS